MRKLISLISTNGKSDEQIKKEVEEALAKDKATNNIKLPEVDKKTDV